MGDSFASEYVGLHARQLRPLPVSIELRASELQLNQRLQTKLIKTCSFRHVQSCFCSRNGPRPMHHAACGLDWTGFGPCAC